MKDTKSDSKESQKVTLNKDSQQKNKTKVVVDLSSNASVDTSKRMDQNPALEKYEGRSRSRSRSGQKSVEKSQTRLLVDDIHTEVQKC